MRLESYLFLRNRLRNRIRLKTKDEVNFHNKILIFVKIFIFRECTEESQSAGNKIPSHNKAKSEFIGKIISNKLLVTAEPNKKNRGIVMEKLLERASPSFEIKKPTIPLLLNETASRKEDDLKLQGRFYDGLSDGKKKHR